MLIGFATCFGAETVLGIPATFLEVNLGAALAFTMFALSFARPFYRMNLILMAVVRC